MVNFASRKNKNRIEVSVSRFFDVCRTFTTLNTLSTLKNFSSIKKKKGQRNPKFQVKRRNFKMHEVYENITVRG